MPRVFLSKAAFDDLRRWDEFLVALQVLTHQPAIGRPVDGGLRELIISRRRSGYLARYAFDEARALVLVWHAFAINGNPGTQKASFDECSPTQNPLPAPLHS